MSKEKSLQKLTQDKAICLKKLCDKIHSKDFTARVHSYKKFATQVSVLRQQGYNVQEYEKHLNEYWSNWQEL